MRRFDAVALTIPLAAALAACSDAPTAPALTYPTHAAKAVAATESDALAISADIQAIHLPYGTIIDPEYRSGDPASPDFTVQESYNRAGDAAIWTGHYLAAESFRYAVTRSADALTNARRALDGLTTLLDVTSPAMPGLLARFAIPESSPWAADILRDEGGKHGDYTTLYNGETWHWLGNTSRDQYTGAFFGLANAYDLIDDPAVRDQVRANISRMLDYLVAHGWNVQMPDGSYSTTFLQRPDQQLAFLQIGRHVDPARWEAAYIAFRAAHGASVGLPWQTECLDPHGSYYKFNLDYANAYHLVRLEEPASPYRATYQAAYQVLRGCTAKHQNAHFNMVDRALAGPSNPRDRQTVKFLGLWLQRPRRDFYRDLRGTYPSCVEEDRACDVIPIPERVNTDFLWQRSPFLLYGGGQGKIETAGIDYILPYWMARYYGVVGG